jgi:V/A-type H+/Na+-transporting ATPase subunit E
MSIDALLLHLEEDAEREATRLRHDAEERAAEIVARADADAARQRALHLERVTAQRRAVGERLVAAARAQARGQFLQARMDVLDRVFDEASGLLERLAVDRYAASVAHLAVDAARYLERRPSVLQSPPDASAAAADAVRDRPDLAVEPADVPAGVTGRSVDGRVVVDNTLAAILVRRRADLAIGLSARIEAP